MRLDIREKFYLNDLRLTDFMALYRIACDPGFFYAYLNERRRPAWLGAARFLGLSLWTRLCRPRHWFMAVREQNNHRLIGCVVLLDLHILEPGLAEIAYFLASSAQGKRIGTGVVLSFVKYALEQYGLRRLYAHVDPDNMASMGILARLNMEPVGYIAANKSKAYDREGRPRPREIWACSEKGLELALSRHHSTDNFQVKLGETAISEV